MITIKHLTLRDFMAIAEADLDFEDAFINVFHGPNGSGKSSLVEAIAICFTERRRGDSYKDFIKHGSEEGASVVLEATIHGEPIKFDIKIRDKAGHTPFTRIITYKKHDYKNSECTTLLQSFDLEYLQQILFSMQGDSNITDLKPGDRTKVLKRLFNYEFTSQIETIDRLTLNDQQALTINNAKLEAALKRAFVYQPLKPILSPVEKQNLNVQLEELKRLEQEVTSKTAEQQGTRKQIDALQIRLNTVNSQRHSLQDEITRLEGSQRTLKASQAKYTQALEGLPSKETLEAAITEKEETIGTLETLVKQNAALVEQLDEELDTRRAELARLATHIAAHEKGECPQCGQATKPEEVPLMKEMQEKETAVYDQFATKKRAISSTKTGAEKSAAALRVEIQSLQHQIASNGTLRTQYEDFLRQTEASLKTTEDALVRKRTDKQGQDDLHASLTSELSALRSGITASENPEILARLIQIPVIEKQLSDDALAANLNVEIERLNDITRQEEASIEKERSDLAKTQNDIFARLNTYKDAKNILEVHLPNYVIVKACSKLEKHINGFIEKVKPGMLVRLFQNKRGVEFFYSPKGAAVKMDEWMTTRMASGFERELLAMAWRVALAKAYDLSVLMLDEIDSAAAVTASERMFRELANLSGFKQLFIISHKPEIVDILVQESDKVHAYYVNEGTFTLQSY